MGDVRCDGQTNGATHILSFCFFVLFCFMKPDNVVVVAALATFV